MEGGVPSLFVRDQPLDCGSVPPFGNTLRPRQEYDEPAKPPAILEIISGGILTGGDFLSFTIEDASAVLDALIGDIPMPTESSILFLIRGDEVPASAHRSSRRRAADQSPTERAVKGYREHSANMAH
jgi:hypothetical protein